MSHKLPWEGAIEEMFHHRLQWWLETSKAFPNQLAEFRPVRSTVEPLLDLVTYMKHEPCHGNVTIARFLMYDAPLK